MASAQRATVAAAETTAFGDDLLLSLLGLRRREGLSPFFTSSGERRKADILTLHRSLIRACSLEEDKIAVRPVAARGHAVVVDQLLAAVGDLLQPSN